MKPKPGSNIVLTRGVLYAESDAKKINEKMKDNTNPKLVAQKRAHFNRLEDLAIDKENEFGG